MPKTTGAQAIVDTLKAYDTELIVGFIGHATHEIAHASSTSGIKTVNPASELGGAYMINAYNYLRGRSAAVGIWHTVGNLLIPPALMDATSGRIPAVHLGLNADGRLAHREGIQQVPNIFTPVTRFDARVERVEMIGDVIHRAFHAAQSHPFGAAYVDIPFDVSADRGEVHIPNGWVAPRGLAAPAAEDIRATLEKLRSAERPLLIVGGGAVISGAGSEITRLAEQLNIPIVSTTTGVGLVPESHPLVLGTAGQVGWTCANEAFAESDFALVLGSRLADWGISQGFTAAMPSEFVQVDLDPQRLGDVYFPTVPVLADVREFVKQLLDAVARAGIADEVHAANAAYVDEVGAKKTEWRTFIDGGINDDQFPLSPWRVIADVQQAMDDDAIIVTDIGNHTSWNLQGVSMNKPHRVLVSFGEGLLGSAVPLGIGAKLAEPDSTVIVATGDGAVQYHLNELRVAVEQNLSIVIVVFNNGAYDANEQMMRLKFPEGSWTQFQNPDYVGICRAYGGEGEKIESAGQLGDALKRGAAAGGPYLIDVPISIDVKWTDNKVSGPVWLSEGRDIPTVEAGYVAVGENLDATKESADD